MLNRQKALLALLDQAGGSASRLTLIKWSFLLSREAPNRGGKAFYGFVPYNHGPYSFCLNQEVGAMIRDGLVDEPNGHTWRLTPAASRVHDTLPAPLRSDVSFVMDEYGHLSTEQLINSVYWRYPWFTVNSQSPRRRALPRPVADLAVYTMGYEGLSVEALLDELMRSGVRRLLDVRANPVSRRYGFHQRTLQGLCDRLDIDYVHLPELGVRAEDRKELNTPSEYEALFARYRREVTSRRAGLIKKVAGALRQKPGVLVCMEADPHSCHRSHLASIVTPVADLPIAHLGWPR